MFECCDNDNMFVEPVIRVTNKKQGLSAVVSKEEFLARVEILKEIYVDGDRERVEEGLRKVVFNRSDEWEKTAGRASDLYSAAM